MLRKLPGVKSWYLLLQFLNGSHHTQPILNSHVLKKLLDVKKFLSAHADEISKILQSIVSQVNNINPVQL